MPFSHTSSRHSAQLVKHKEKFTIVLIENERLNSLNYQNGLNFSVSFLKCQPLHKSEESLKIFLNKYICKSCKQLLRTRSPAQHGQVNGET
jgi:hypothetical protein